MPAFPKGGQCPIHLGQFRPLACAVRADVQASSCTGQRTSAQRRADRVIVTSQTGSFYRAGLGTEPVLLSPISLLPARVNDFFRCRRWLCSRSRRSMAIAMPARGLLRGRAAVRDRLRGQSCSDRAVHFAGVNGHEDNPNCCRLRACRPRPGAVVGAGQDGNVAGRTGCPGRRRRCRYAERGGGALHGFYAAICRGVRPLAASRRPKPCVQ
ncbi:hypothetical protein LMG27177_04008 [Paraburkholderia fynbosensis]|uniref:Uncharacterized protein n=1 Tax=Paraburkholderia fynbosensis TaxID=1200993 RepID=A0A6J5GFM5_9BURK|nr:hypothetical protein LMG27177_04008 [Paraburkholderia fynbosensis]